VPAGAFSRGLPSEGAISSSTTPAFSSLPAEILPTAAATAASSDPLRRQLPSQRPAHDLGQTIAGRWQETIPSLATDFGELPPPPQVVAIRPLSVQPIPREEPEALSLDLTPGPPRTLSTPTIETRGLDAIDEAQLLRELEELDPGKEGAPLGVDDASNDGPLPHVPRSSQAIAIPPHAPPSTRGRPESLPSVIVNIDTEFLALVDRLAEDAQDEHAEAELLRQGQHAMPAIMARFPGPITLAPADVAERGPRVSECGPILRLIAGQRRVALPFVLAQVDDPDPDRRFWATFLLTELSYTEAVPAIVARLFDEHDQTRRVARLAAKAVAEGARESLVAELDRIVHDPGASEEKRIATMDALGEMRDALVVPVLIGAIGDDVESVALAARRALTVAVRQDFGHDTRRWLAWWSSNSSRHRVEWLIDALTHDDAPMRGAAAEELKAVTKEFFGYYEDLPKRDRERAQQRYRDWWRSEGRARFRRG
jgi:HEAT repeat protein